MSIRIIYANHINIRTNPQVKSVKNHRHVFFSGHITVGGSICNLALALFIATHRT